MNRRKENHFNHRHGRAIEMDPEGTKAGSFYIFRQRCNICEELVEGGNVRFGCSISEEPKQSMGVASALKKEQGLFIEASRPEFPIPGDKSVPLQWKAGSGCSVLKSQ